jgi:hypothetical protein
MEKIQLPSRVMDVFAAIKVQGFTVEFYIGSTYNIVFKIFDCGELKCMGSLLKEKDFDFSDSTYTKIIKLLGDYELYKKSAAVLKYLEDKFSN